MWEYRLSCARMKRGPWIIVIVVLAITAGAGVFAFKRYEAWKEAGREEAGVAYSALAVCLVGGPEPILPIRASEYTSRLHDSADDPTLAACVSLRDKLLQSSYIRREMGHFAEAAQTLNLGPFAERPEWHLEYFFRLGSQLPWHPPTLVDGKPIPKPMHLAIESQTDSLLMLPAMFSATEIDTRIDPYPSNEVRIGEEKNVDVVIADSADKRLVQALRIEKPKREPKTPPQPREVKEIRPIYLENSFFWVEGDRFYSLQPEEKKAKFIQLPSAKISAIRSCRAPNRRIFGIELSDVNKLALYSFRDQGLTPAGVADLADKPTSPSPHGGYRSRFTISCDDETVRIAWAIAESTGPTKMDPRGNWALPPGGFQNIRVETCTKGACTRKEKRIELDAGVLGVGDFGPNDWAKTAVDAYSVGEWVLLVWRDQYADRYRFAPIDELPTARNEYLTQFASAPWIQQGGPSIPPPVVRLLTRGDVALASLLIEQTGRRFAIVVRFDGEGHVDAVPLVEKR